MCLAGLRYRLQHLGQATALLGNLIPAVLMQDLWEDMNDGNGAMSVYTNS